MNSTIQAWLRQWLRRAGLYERVKGSWIYDWYWSLADRQIVEDKRREIEFYRNLLVGFRKGDLIFDVGANQGYKTDIFLKLGARVVAVEPDEASQELLNQRFLKHRLRGKPVVIVPKAVSDRSSTQTLWIEAPGSAKNTLSQKWVETLRDDDTRFGRRLNFGQWKDVKTVSMEQLITEHGLPFFVKIDVEGHEVSVLRGIQRAVPFLSFEVNLPEFRSEGLECVRILSSLAREGEFNFTPDCRRGLELERWVEAEEFCAVLRSCTDKSIDVFWKAPVSQA